MGDGLKRRHTNNIHEQNVIRIVDNTSLTDSVTLSGSNSVMVELFLPQTILLGIWPE
jgi:hypothetical protein